MQLEPQSVGVVPMPKMPLAPSASTVFSAVPPPEVQDEGAVANAPLSPTTWNGMADTFSPPI